MTTLREVQDFLKTVPSDFVFSSGFAEAHAWAGCPHKVAFEQASNISALELIANIADATFEPFEFYSSRDITYVMFSLNCEGHLRLMLDTWSENDADNFTVMFNNMKREFAAKTVEGPRRTKRQKMEEMEAAANEQKATDFQSYTDTYQTRLLKLIVGFSDFNIQIQNVNGDLHLFARASYSADKTITARPFSIDPKKDVDDPEWEEDEFQLTRFESFLADELEEVRKAKESYSAKQKALAKLTKEEKQLLGLL